MKGNLFHYCISGDYNEDDVMILCGIHKNVCISKSAADNKLAWYFFIYIIVK